VVADRRTCGRDRRAPEVCRINQAWLHHAGVRRAPCCGRRACGLTPSGGSANLRPAEQLAHLRTIREHVRRCTPQGQAYIELFERFGPELVRILLDDQEPLRRIDPIVARTLEACPLDSPGVMQAVGADLLGDSGLMPLTARGEMLELDAHLLSDAARNRCCAQLPH
jgi:hypothetical protein